MCIYKLDAKVTNSDGHCMIDRYSLFGNENISAVSIYLVLEEW